jgi:ABC-type phosphate/phosphonate transport system substrate-binding protein
MAARNVFLTRPATIRAECGIESTAMEQVIHISTPFMKTAEEMIRPALVRMARAACLLVVPGLLVLITITLPAWAQGNSPTVRYLGFSLAVFEGTDSRDANAAVEVWARELLRTEGTKNTIIKSKVFENLEDMSAAVKSKSIDFIMTSSLDYLKLQHSCRIQPAVVGTRRGAYGESGILITHSSSGITAPADLSGKSFAAVKNSRGTMYQLWFTQEWEKAIKGQSKTVFPKLKSMTKEEQVVYAVFFKKIDAGLVSQVCLQTMTEQNPQLAREIKIIGTSPKFLGSLMCWAGHVDASARAEFMELISKIHKNPSGNQILKLFQTDQMLEFKPEYITSVQELSKGSMTMGSARSKR